MGNRRRSLIQMTKSIRHLRRTRLQPPQTAATQLDPQLALLRGWQTDRLAVTHEDLLSSDRYGAACQFFLDDIYAPRDFSQRNAAFDTLHDSLKRYLPPTLVSILAAAIELNKQTDVLDEALLKVLVDELGMTDELTAEMYAEAYRRSDNYAERDQQLNQLVTIGRQVDSAMRVPLIGPALKVAHRPAHRAGWGEVQDFLERGHAAFKKMKGADQFLNTIYQREKLILDQIYAGNPHPFSLEGDDAPAS